MSKTLFKFTSFILIHSLLSGCNNSNTSEEADPLKGHENKFLDVSVNSNPKEIVFYDLVDPKAKDKPKPDEEASASEPEEQERKTSDPLPEGVIEAIREKAEIEERKTKALKTIAEAKHIEKIITGQDSISDDGYTYSSDE